MKKDHKMEKMSVFGGMLGKAEKAIKGRKSSIDEAVKAATKSRKK